MRASSCFWALIVHLFKWAANLVPLTESRHIGHCAFNADEEEDHGNIEVSELSEEDEPPPPKPNCLDDLGIPIWNVLLIFSKDIWFVWIKKCKLLTSSQIKL